MTEQIHKIGDLFSRPGHILSSRFTCMLSGVFIFVKEQFADENFYNSKLKLPQNLLKVFVT